MVGAGRAVNGGTQVIGARVAHAPDSPARFCCGQAIQTTPGARSHVSSVAATARLRLSIGLLDFRRLLRRQRHEIEWPITRAGAN
jgi:hypothetical protein